MLKNFRETKRYIFLIILITLFISFYVFHLNIKKSEQLYILEIFDVVEDICIESDDIYIVGWKFDMNYQKCISCLAKLDENGNIIWNVTWVDGDGSLARSISCDNNYIYVLSEIKNETYHYICFKKFDSKGELLLSRCWKHENNPFISDIKIIENDIYFILNGKLIKINREGEIIWVRDLNGKAVNLDILFNRIYVAGFTTKNATGGCDTILACFDFDGNLIWYTKRESVKGDMPIKVCATPSGIYLLVIGSKGWKLRTIIKFDLEGNQKWDKSSKTYIDIKYYNGYLYSAGAIKEDSSSDLLKLDALISKLNLNGEIIWNKKFGESNREDYAHGVFVNEKGIFIVGTTESYGKYPERKGFLIIIKNKGILS